MYAPHLRSCCCYRLACRLFQVRNAAVAHRAKVADEMFQRCEAAPPFP